MQNEDEERDEKTPRERFRALAQPRLDRALHAIKVLGNCGNRGSYEYTHEEASQIVTAIEDAAKKLRESFTPKEKATGPKISFSDDELHPSEVG